MVIAALWIYSPALHGTWLWDDGLLITNNPNLRGFVGLWNIWFKPASTDYWPLSWTVLWLEWHLWGHHTLGCHLCSLLLHVWSGCLIWKLLEKLGLKWGWVGGFLFVIHPLAVESVAWISEIKNTLSLPFYLLAFDSFLAAEENQDDFKKLLTSILYYLIAMLCKTSTIMLPAVLLFYCYWKRETISAKDVIRIIPYVAIALVLGLITIHFQNSQNSGDSVVEARGLIHRIENAGSITMFYIRQFVVPNDLIPIYPGWTLTSASVVSFFVLPFLGLILWSRRRKKFAWARTAVLGLAFYWLNLVPVMGFIKMSYRSISEVADHLVYLPMIGLIGLVAGGWELAYRQSPAQIRPFLIVSIMAVGTLLAWKSHAYARVFTSEPTLWAYTLQHNPTSWDAHANLGNILLEQGKLADAMDQYEVALKLRPEFCVSHCLMGDVLAQMPGRLPNSISEYETALQLDPDYPKARVSLGVALVREQRFQEAINQFREALRTDPLDFRAHLNLAEALEMNSAEIADAVAEYRAALQINPHDVAANYRLAVLLSRNPDDSAEAINRLGIVLQARPDLQPAKLLLNQLLKNQR